MQVLNLQNLTLLQFKIMHATGMQLQQINIKINYLVVIHM